MILFLAILIILAEAVGEGLLKRYALANWIFNPILQWVIAFVLFGVWLLIVIGLNDNQIPLWKLIVGFPFVRFPFFDPGYNLAAGNKWNYYGTRKFYDKTMVKLASFGWFLKVCCGIIGIVFLMGWK